jgi:hypothetical protein
MAQDHILLREPGGIGYFALMADALGGRRRRVATPVKRAASDEPATPSGFTSALRLMTESEARDYNTAAFALTPTSRYHAGNADADPAAAAARAKTALWMAAGYVGTATMLVGVLNFIEGVTNPVQTAVYAVAGALVATIAFRGAWRAITRSSGVPSVLETPPYEVKAPDNVVPFAPPLSENCARVLR